MLVLLGLARAANAVETSDYLMDLWTSDDNLPGTSVTSVTQTPDGYLWIGTFNGLARFDGVRFTNFDPANTRALKHARVTGLFTDDEGTLWINTYDNSMTSFRNGVFTHEWQGAKVINLFSTSNRIYLATIASGIGTRLKTPGGSNQWQTIALDTRRSSARYFCQDAAGTLWCLLHDGSIKLIRDTNVTSLPAGNGLGDEKINCLAADSEGRIWAGTNKKIRRWNGEAFIDETPTNGEPEVAITFLFSTRSNGLWVFANNSVRHANNRQWTASTSAWSDLVQSDPLYVRAYEERNGNVWFRQYGHGLFCAGADGIFTSLSSAQGLPDNRVSSWFQDREGNLWLGMDYGGLLRLRQRPFQIIGDDNLKNVPVTTVCEDNHSNIWFGTFDHGLNRWNGGQLKSFKLPEGANRNAIFSACPDAQGRIWLSADHEDLFVLETNHINRSDASIHGIKSILADSQNRIWLGRLNQLTSISNSQTTSYGPSDGFERRDVRALTEDRQGNIWIGTGNGVLYKFANETFSSFKPDEATDTQAIWSLLPEDDGTVWIGTFRGGLLRFKNGKFTRYTTSEGLPSDVISQILDDGLGKLWFGSHKGIFSVRKNDFAAFDRGEIPTLPCVTYGLNDGLPTLECFGNYQPTACRGHDGNLWFTTVKGLVTVSPRQVQINQLPPSVVLEDFLVDGKSIGTKGAIKITPGRHQFEFQFTALSFTAPDKVKFRCRLNGFDNDWSKPGTSRNVTYGPLPPGKYEFQVIACNNDGVWNMTGASLTVLQQPFFWQTWWFIIAVSMASVTTIAAAVSYAATRRLQRKLERLKQQRAIEIERERIAKDIHDDLGAGLTQIMFQSSLAKNAPTERIQTDLSQISETARDLVRTMDEIVWAIDPENDTLDGLTTYLGKYVQDYLTAAKLRCRLDLPTELPPIPVAAETRHNLYLAIKESLNNVVKHAQAKEVLFQLKLQPGVFTFIIKDDGVGLMDSKTKTDNALRLASGHGLRNLTQRLESVGGTCAVVSEPGQGTRIELAIPSKNPRTTKINSYEQR
jgi:signal transduction histidine kinase/ligand-binding sensor domain-containing protein